MKVERNKIDKDLYCDSSISFLSEKIHMYFKAHYPNDDYWITDDYQKSKTSPHSKTTHIILYGNYLRSFFESEFWPGEQIQIWVLSQVIKDVLTKLFELPKYMISVIPRDYLSPTDKTSTAEFTYNFIYGGRLSRQKNTLDLLLTTLFLQHQADKRVSLKLYGEFDNNYHFHKGRYAFAHDFKEVVSSSLECLDWKNPPLIKNGLDSSQWVDEITTADTFISFSKFFMEDYGASIAQIKNKNVFSILSHWGGFRDFNDLNTRFVASSLIKGHTSPLSIRAAASKVLAKKILQRNYITPRQEKEKYEKQASFAKDQLTDYRLRSIKKWGPTLCLILRDRPELFADGTKGEQLYLELETILSGHENPMYTDVFIYNQLGNETTNEMREFYTKALNLLKDDGVQILSYDGLTLFSKRSTEVILQARAIYVTKDTNTKVLEHLKTLGCQIEKLQTNTSPLPFGLEKIKNLV